MPYSDRKLREAEKRQAGHAQGRDTRLPRLVAGHALVGDDAMAVIMALPISAAEMDMQDLDDPTKLKFIPGISVPGGPDVP